MNIFVRVKTALDTLTGIPNAQGRMLSTGALPDQFLVYTLVSGSGELHADDHEIGRAYLVQVSIFSRSGLASLPDVNGAMMVAGFTLGDERELPQDAQSGHYHLAKDFNYYQEGD